jgi:Tol biopolymer transport system component
VLVRMIAGSNEIVRVRLADGASQLVTDTRDLEESWPYWSEHAGRLVFLAATAGAPNDLLLWDPATRVTTALTRTPRRDEQWPAWSPQRPELAFAFRGGSPPGGLALAETSRGTRRLLAVAGGRDLFYRPSFAPDGAWLVAQRRGADGRGSHLWRIREGAAPEPLTGDEAWFDMKPVPTRDGREIVFTRRPTADGKRDVVAIPAQGGAARSLASTPHSDDHSASPSPRRDEIAFVSDRGGPSALYLAPLDGGPPRELLRDGERNLFAPRWSPDGERLAAIATPRSVGEPRLSDRRGLAETHTLVCDREGRVLFDAPGFMPDWMPPWP